MFESLTITGTLWYQFVDRTSSLTFVSGLYIIIIGSSVELQCHVFVEGRRKNLMSRCSNSSPRYSVGTTMLSLLILKISYVFNNKISITLLSFLICLGRSFPNPTTKVVKSCDNHLCCNRFICSLYKIGALQFHTPAFPLLLYRLPYVLP